VHTRAFTIVEMMLVIALIGLLAGAAGWSLTKSVQRSTRADVADRIREMDRMTRAAAQRLGRRYVLRIDLEKQRLWRAVDRGHEMEAASHAFHLPPRYRVKRMLVPRQAGERGYLHDGRPATEQNEGCVNIAYSTGGQSVTYALRLVPVDSRADSGGAGAQRRSQWLVFSGLTGQMTKINEREAVENLFAHLTTGRADAD
jgi:prepilin-type N-terminal cleavage/methylation domain-containing protein